MNYKLIILLFLIAFISCNNSTSTTSEISKDIPVRLADPTIFYDNGAYYLYGTGGDVNNGFIVYTSTDLKKWEGPKGANNGFALSKGDSYGDRGFWAPQVLKYNGKYFIIYTANEQLAIAYSSSPLGPFKQDSLKCLTNTGRQIDPFVFFDNNQVYMYHVRLNEGNKIYVSRFKDDLSDFKDTTAILCIESVEKWENTDNVRWSVAEGPTVFKGKDNIYYIIYSSNDFRNKNYAVGYATSKSPFGPWEKYEGNPIISKSILNIDGPGHGDIFYDKDNRIKYVLHTHYSATQVSPRKTGIIDLSLENGIIEAYPETFDFLYSKDIYSNPVFSRSMPDPSIIKSDNGDFYLYATENTRNTPILKSRNLVNWEFVGTAFTDSTRPAFEPKGGLWAPDINYINGKYVLYYSMSVWGGEWTCGIGAAIADKPEGPFTDKGKLFISNEIDVRNSIDQFYIEENGKKYLFWGSFRGIYAIELNDDGLSVKNYAEKRQIAGTAFEGVYIHKRDNYYYLFASIGSCCEGINSTYQLVVGRSESLFGHYLDKEGKDMMNNGYSVVIAPNKRFVGNGHCSEIVQDDAGNDWIFYHGVDVNRPRGRLLLLDRVRWDDNNWPYIKDGSPSVFAESPYFKIQECEINKI
jgi:arabinan endo-1,5-alpha-L-arabinosidase